MVDAAERKVQIQPREAQLKRNVDAAVGAETDSMAGVTDMVMDMVTDLGTADLSVMVDMDLSVSDLMVDTDMEDISMVALSHFTKYKMTF